MSVYTLLKNITTVQAAPYQDHPPSQVAHPPLGTDGACLAVKQTFALVVTSTTLPGGPIAATVQPVVSNDRQNWFPYGNPLSTDPTSSPATAMSEQDGAWAYFGAYVVSLTGAGATVQLQMSA